MKVRVEITLDIDTEAWSLEYGVEGASAIREDVKTHVTQSTLAHFSGMGLLVGGPR